MTDRPGPNNYALVMTMLIRHVQRTRASPDDQLLQAFHPKRRAPRAFHHSAYQRAPGAALARTADGHSVKLRSAVRVAPDYLAEAEPRGRLVGGARYEVQLRTCLRNVRT